MHFVCIFNFDVFLRPKKLSVIPMKRLLFILSLTLLCLCACKKNDYPQLLINAEKLADVNSDSAIIILDSIGKGIANYSKDIQMYYQLLTIKAKDKSYITHTSDSLILPIIDYYTKAKDNVHLPEAYYYAGRIYCDLGDAPRATSYFQQALDMTDKSHQPKLRNLINSQMGNLLFEQCLYKESISFFKETYQISEQGKDTISMIYDLRDIATSFIALEIQDSALVYLKKANYLINITGEKRLGGMINGLLTNVYTQSKQYDKAKQYIYQALQETDEQMQSGTYSIAAELYKQIEEKDSALHYYQLLIDCGELYAKADATWNLAEYALQDGNVEKADLYLKQYITAIDSVWQRNDTKNVRKIRSMYNYNLREKENNRLKIENKQKQIYLIGTICSIVILLVCFLAYFQYSQKKHLQLNLQLLKLNLLEEKRKEMDIIQKEKKLKSQQSFKDSEIYRYFQQSKDNES